MLQPHLIINFPSLLLRVEAFLWNYFGKWVGLEMRSNLYIYMVCFVRQTCKSFAFDFPSKCSKKKKKSYHCVWHLVALIHVKSPADYVYRLTLWLHFYYNLQVWWSFLGRLWSWWSLWCCRKSLMIFKKIKWKIYWYGAM